MRIIVDRGRCAGHALCAAKNPELFPLDDDGFSIADGVEVPPGLEKDAAAGAHVCPEGAITLAD
jgi:ferredoxin